MSQPRTSAAAEPAAYDGEPLDIAPGLQWYGARGELHDGGVPPCLQGAPGHYAWIRFGYSVAHGLHGESWRPVDWVQCLTHHP